MFNEENAVEIVQRNLIMLRNSMSEPNTLKRKIFSLCEVKNHLTLSTTNGLGVRKLVEICDIMNVSIDEMFYIDEQWTFDEHWEWNNQSNTRYFREPESDITVHNYGDIIYDNVQWSIDMGQTSLQDWKNVLRSHNMNMLDNNPSYINFGCRLLGRISEELDVNPEDLLYIKS